MSLKETLPLIEPTSELKYRKVYFGILTVLLILLAGTLGANILLFDRNGLSSYKWKKEIEEKIESCNFNGDVNVRVNGNAVYSDSFGNANEELQVEMTGYHKFGVASNSKLFVAVALYQLQERGKVNVSMSVSEYLDEEDMKAFGVWNETRWCPTFNGICQNITIQQLLAMSSGIVDAFNCDDIGYDSPYCVSFDSEEWYLYKGSIAKYVAMFIHSPLQFVPGTSYSYSNPNFILGAYLVEKISQMSFEQYLVKYILIPLELTDTAFHAQDGTVRIISNLTDSYRNFYRQNGDFISTGTCRPYLTLGGFSGAGGIVSTTSNMMTWYESLFRKGGSKILSDDSIQQIVKPWNVVLPIVGNRTTSYYGQGVFVNYENAATQEWPTSVVYCGELKCTFSCIAMHQDIHGNEVVVTAFTNHAHIYVENENDLHQHNVDTLLRIGKANQTLGGASNVRSFLMNYDWS